MFKSISEVRMENVERLMKESGLSRKEFSDKASITYAQFSQYFGKNPQKIIGDAIARRIETAFELEQFWLDQNWNISNTVTVGGVSVAGSNTGMIGGQGNTQNNYGNSYDLKQTVLSSKSSDEPPAHLKDMPLLDIDMGVMFALNPTILDNAIYDTAERVATFIPHSERTFGIKNSADIVGITPSTIRKGDILIIEPCIMPRDNDLVLLCVNYNKENRGVIARLSVDLLGNRTVQHNGTPPEPMPVNSLICGVVVEIKRRLLDTALVKARLNPNWDIRNTLVVES